MSFAMFMLLVGVTFGAIASSFGAELDVAIAIGGFFGLSVFGCVVRFEDPSS